MSQFRRGAVAMLAEKIVKMASQLGTMVLLARFLGPADLGSLMYCYALASVFLFLNNFGLNTILVKWLAEEPHNSRHYLKHAFLLRFTAAFGSMLLTNLAGLWLVDSESRVLLLLISLYHLLMPVSLVEWFFQSQGRAVNSAYGLIAGSVVGFFVRLVVLLLGGDILWLGAAYSIELAAVGLMYSIIWRKETLAGEAVVTKDALLSMAKQALPLLLSGAVIMLYMRIDQLMLGYMIGDAEVGVYSAAVRLSEAWYFVGLTILGVYFPRFLQIRQTQGEQAYLNAIVRIGRIVVWVGVALGVSTMVIADWLIHLLYGQGFNEATNVLVVSIWAVPFVYLGYVATQIYIHQGLQSVILYRSLAALLLNVIANYLLIPDFGAVGAAYALLLAQFLSGVVFNIFHKLGFIRYIYACIFWPFGRNRDWS
jgi:O-antigen/teichoic acid export membrane protein